MSSIPVYRYFPVYRRGLVTDTGQECGDQHRVGGRHPQEGRVQATGDQEGGDGGGSGGGGTNKDKINDVFKAITDKIS